MKEEATAIAANDRIAEKKFLHYMLLYDIHRCKQVNLMCVNDKYFCYVIKPSLTTKKIPCHQMGQGASKLLLKQLETPVRGNCPECIDLPEGLNVPASSVRIRH
ncbi:MAG: substrate-binding domain-containing protein [Phycisphaerae bacterium]|nr:substrate-binding domain-containing protein [Phycisphaerae bacterium]